MVLEAELQDPPLGLALHDRVDRPQRRRQRGAVIVVVEEVGVQVEGVDRVELGDVDEVDPHRPGPLDRDGLLRIGVRHGVDGVDLVLVVEIGVEGVHHHDQLLPPGVLGRAQQPAARRLGLVGMAGGIGVDDEGAVHALVDVTAQRHEVAVIEVAAEGEGVELVDELAAGFGHAGAGHPVHPRRMDAVEMHGVGMRAPVPEPDPHAVALGDPDRRARHAAVVGPGREHDPRGDLDLLVLGGDLELAHGAAGVVAADRAGVPVGQHGERIEAVPSAVDGPDSGHAAVIAMRRRSFCGVGGLAVFGVRLFGPGGIQLRQCRPSQRRASDDHVPTRDGAVTWEFHQPSRP